MCVHSFSCSAVALTLSTDAKEEHGAAYFRNYQKWAPGALRELLRLWNTHPDQHMFKCGTFGSVYFDVDLASKGVTKRTRVTFMKEEEDGRMWIMLDATFDDVFEACN